MSAHPSHNPGRPLTTTVLAAGATGYLGRFIVADLRRRGLKVRAITRIRQRAVSRGPWGSPALEGLVAHER